jgi:lipopolysaccharide export system protein LptA
LARADAGLGQGVQGMNFKVAEFFEAPHQNQMKFLLEGAKAQQRGKGQVLFTDPKWQTYRQTGEREMLMEAPECLYDSVRKAINSAGSFRLHTADGKLSMEGTGFLWQQTNSSLAISNGVHTIVHPDLFSGQNTNQSRVPAETDRRIEIFSDHFDYETGSGLGIYRGHVRVVGTNLVLLANTLSFQLPMRERQLQSITANDQVSVDYQGIQATGQQAIYTADKDLIQLTGQPSWRTATQEGRGDELLLDRTNQVLRSLGHAYLKMRGQSLERSLLASPNAVVTNRAPATNQFLEIRCDGYEIRTNTAAFRQQVQVTEMVGEEARGKMTSDTLNVSLSGSNQLQRLVAFGQVSIEQGDERFQAGQAIYDATNATLELTQNPTWSAGLRSGSGERISLVQGEEMVVRGRALMRLPAHELAQTAVPAVASATNTPSKEQVALISSEDYSLRKDSAHFQGKVHVAHPQMDWHCETLTVHFANGTQVDQILAENSVIFDLSDEKGQKIRGTGQKAVYTYSVTAAGTNDLVELTGDPVLVTTNGIFQNKVIYLDRAHNRLLAPGNYKITAPSTPAGTNLFTLPKVKIIK